MGVGATDGSANTGQGAARGERIESSSQTEILNSSFELHPWWRAAAKRRHHCHGVTPDSFDMIHTWTPDLNVELPDAVKGRLLP